MDDAEYTAEMQTSEAQNFEKAIDRISRICDGAGISFIGAFTRITDTVEGRVQVRTRTMVSEGKERIIPALWIGLKEMEVMRRNIEQLAIKHDIDLSLYFGKGSKRACVERDMQKDLKRVIRRWQEEPVNLPGLPK